MITVGAGRPVMKKPDKATGQQRVRFERGLPDYHDPTAGIGGAAPAYSALTLRLVLAMVSLVLSIAVAVFGMLIDVPWLYWAMAVVIVIVVIDIAVIVRRKRRGEPG